MKQNTTVHETVEKQHFKFYSKIKKNGMPKITTVIILKLNQWDYLYAVTRFKGTAEMPNNIDPGQTAS